MLPVARSSARLPQSDIIQGYMCRLGSSQAEYIIRYIIRYADGFLYTRLKWLILQIIFRQVAVRCKVQLRKMTCI